VLTELQPSCDEHGSTRFAGTGRLTEMYEPLKAHFTIPNAPSPPFDRNFFQNESSKFWLPLLPRNGPDRNSTKEIKCAERQFISAFEVAHKLTKAREGVGLGTCRDFFLLLLSLLLLLLLL
jgi:hypothetical protein